MYAEWDEISNETEQKLLRRMLTLFACYSIISFDWLICIGQVACYMFYERINH